MQNSRRAAKLTKMANLLDFWRMKELIVSERVNLDPGAELFLFSRNFFVT